MLTMSSARVSAHCTPLKSSEHMAYVILLYKRSSQSLSRNYCMRLLPGGGLRERYLDQQWVEAVLRRSKRSGLYSSRQTASEIIDSADDKLFDQVIRGNHHVLHQLLTDRVDISYNLRSRAHTRALPEKKDIWLTKTLSLECCISTHTNELINSFALRSHLVTLCSL